MILFRAGAVLVVAGLRIGSLKDYEDDRAYKRNESDEDPPAALADVMQTTEDNCKAGNQKCERDKAACELKNSSKNRNTSEDSRYQTANNADDKIEENEIPILTAACAAVKVCVVFLEYAFYC